MTEQIQAARVRLAELMDERRGYLGLHWNEVAERAGLTKEGLRAVRFDIRTIRPSTKRGIERALRWETGSVERILDGGDPIEAAGDPESVTMSSREFRAILARLAAVEARLAVLEARGV